MGVFVAGAGWNHTAVRNFADRVLELNGGVVDVKARRQFLPNLPQQIFTLGSAHVGNADVARQRVGDRKSVV